MTTNATRNAVHTENEVSFSDSLINLRAEEEVLPSACLDDFIKTWFVDGKVVAVPGLNSGLGDVHKGDLNLRAFQGNHSHCL